jgi:uncharacterized protein YoxC
MMEAAMAEPATGISARLWSLPGQLLLALINATVVLAIVAAILVILALVRIEHFAANVAATMTSAVLTKVDLPSKEVLLNIRELNGEIRALGNTLREIKTGENPALQEDIARLRERLATLRTSIDGLSSARAMLTDEAAARFGERITQELMKLRDCSSSVRANGPSSSSELQFRHKRQPLPPLNNKSSIAHSGPFG